MSRRRFVFGTSDRLPSPLAPGFFATDRDAESNSDLDRAVLIHTKAFPLGPRSTDSPISDDRSSPATSIKSSFAPFDEHLDDPIETPQWQIDLDDLFVDVFGGSTLSACPIDDVVAEALHIIESPTQEKVYGLAQALALHWMHKICRSGDANACSPKTVALIARITDHLGCISDPAERDFVNELNFLCIEKLKLTWRLYLSDIANLQRHRGELFRRSMVIVTMIGHLFHGGQVQAEAILGSLENIAEMFILEDAMVIMHALLRELGLTFARERAARCFIENLLADAIPFTEFRSEYEPFCQAVFAINALAAQWYDNGTYNPAYHRTRMDKFRTHLLPQM